jgi:hypothetical protein
LEIVKDRAEAAEDELERLITEINDNQDGSSVSSEKSAESSAPSPVSTGSDDVFDGSPAEKTQIAAFWEVGHFCHFTFFVFKQISFLLSFLIYTTYDLKAQ